MPSVLSKFAEASRSYSAELFRNMTFRERAAFAMKMARENKMFGGRSKTCRLTLCPESMDSGELKCLY